MLPLVWLIDTARRLIEVKVSLRTLTSDDQHLTSTRSFEFGVRGTALGAATSVAREDDGTGACQETLVRARQPDRLQLRELTLVEPFT